MNDTQLSLLTIKIDTEKLYNIVKNAQKSFTIFEVVKYQRLMTEIIV